ncbi:MAG: tripartite tricarboxylate transporter family receptor [Hyphomicrobiales bacterium]|nr:tripartite tricarboxylate transporter family receptor [Hyphomicrobiales bacterium]
MTRLCHFGWSALARRLGAVCALAGALSATTGATAQEDFYRGKTVTFIIGFGPGGGYDLYARVLGRHIANHIPGRPNVVTQNLEGAGSVRAANFV